MSPSWWRRLRADRLTVVVLDHVVPHGTPAGDGQSLVVCPVLMVVGDGILAAVAAADGVAGHDGDATENLGTRTGDSIGDCAAVAEPGGEDQLGVDAKILLDCFQDGVDKQDVFPPVLPQPR